MWPPFSPNYFHQDSTIPKHLNYTILTNNFYRLGSLYPYLNLNERLYDIENETWSSYYTSCFTSVQNEIDRKFIAKVSKNSKIPKVVFRKFAYPSVKFDHFLQQFAVYMLPVFIVIAFTYSVKNIIKVSKKIMFN